MKSKLSDDDFAGKTRFTVQFACQGCIKRSYTDPRYKQYWRNYNDDMHCDVCGTYNEKTYLRKIDENGKLVRLNSKD